MKRALEPTSLGAEVEARLRREASSWEAPTDASSIPWATEAEIPVLDLGPYFETGRVDDLEAVASQLRAAASSTGFHFITNHGVPAELVADTFQAAWQFHAQPAEAKRRCAMDAAPSRAGEVRAGCGYLETANWKLPAREKPNMVAAFVVKRDIVRAHRSRTRCAHKSQERASRAGTYLGRSCVEHPSSCSCAACAKGPRDVTLDKMPWPDESGDMLGFRESVE
eukprot:3892826-Prymnesium_polylepis.2